MGQNFVKYDGYNVEPVRMLLLGSGRTGKSQLVKVIYNTILETLIYHCKDLENPRVFFFSTTCISAVNIDGTTIHSGLGVRLLALITNIKLL